MALLALALLALQAAGTPAAGILGTWRGTSVCVDRRADPACGDEEVVYVVDSAAGPRGPVRMRADKIVNGLRESMGALRLAYDSTTRSWSAELTLRLRVRWSFTPKDDQLAGTLVEVPSGRLIRRISARRVPS